jgi:hypothetical protein
LCMQEKMYSALFIRFFNHIIQLLIIKIKKVLPLSILSLRALFGVKLHVKENAY